jgi:hypothetical protein
MLVLTPACQAYFVTEMWDVSFLNHSGFRLYSGLFDKPNNGVPLDFYPQLGLSSPILPGHCIQVNDNVYK